MQAGPCRLAILVPDHEPFKDITIAFKLIIFSTGLQWGTPLDEDLTLTLCGKILSAIFFFLQKLKKYQCNLVLCKWQCFWSPSMSQFKHDYTLQAKKAIFHLSLIEKQSQESLGSNLLRFFASCRRLACSIAAAAPGTSPARGTFGP